MSQPQTTKRGQVVAGALAPHPPHLIYAEGPKQNEPKGECGWEVLRWGYEDLRRRITPDDYDVMIVHSPHWKTVTGTHLLACPEFKGLSVDPIFPNLFRFSYDLQVDCDVAKAIHAKATEAQLSTQLMENPDFRVDYGTIISCHLLNPAWDKPIVALSSHQAHHTFSNEVGESLMMKLGAATREAVEESGKRALVVGSCSMSHRHFTTEAEVPEDMSNEHIYNHNQYLWDMHMIDLLRQGKNREALQTVPDFIDGAISEFKDGSFTWMMAAMGVPNTPATLHAYGSVIGTGNLVASWKLSQSSPQGGRE